MAEVLIGIMDMWFLKVELFHWPVFFPYNLLALAIGKEAIYVALQLLKVISINPKL
jgi:hypothetical protein